MFFLFFVYFWNLKSCLLATPPLKILVSLPPFLSPLKSIAKDRAVCFSLIPEGKNPHHYDISVKDSLMFSDVNIFFFSGQDFLFEKRLLKSIRHQKKNIHLVNLSEKLTLLSSSCSQCSHSHDPHIWMSLKNMALIALTIKEHLSLIDPRFSDFYEKNYRLYVLKLTELQKHFNQLITLPHRSYFVFHSAWNYFDRDFQLHSISLELPGSSLSIRRLHHLKQQKNVLPLLFYSPHDNPDFVKRSAFYLNCQPFVIDILSEDYLHNILNILQSFSLFCSDD